MTVGADQVDQAGGQQAPRLDVGVGAIGTRQAGGVELLQGAGVLHALGKTGVGWLSSPARPPLGMREDRREPLGADPSDQPLHRRVAVPRPGLRSVHQDELRALEAEAPGVVIGAKAVRARWDLEAEAYLEACGCPRLQRGEVALDAGEARP